MILSFKMALRSISANKLRAMLTMLGIIIGVMALVVLVSLVNGQHLLSQMRFRLWAAIS